MQAGGREDGWALVDVKNRFSLNDRLEIIHPQGNVEMILTEMRGKHNEAVDVAAGSGILVKIPLADSFDGAMLARLL